MSQALASGAHVHLGIAERGKQYALSGDHSEALRHYREAMQRAIQVSANEVFLRHYTQCALESLERLGAFDEVLAACTRAQEHYQAHPPQDDIARKDLASFLEREAVVLIKLGRREQAQKSLAAASTHAKPQRLPLADTLATWLRSNLHITSDRLERELIRQRYWSVRPEKVRADLAVSLSPTQPDP